MKLYNPNKYPKNDKKRPPEGANDLPDGPEKPKH
jgi:hypothetical protein